MLRGVFVTDFDGTMTERDFYELALERFLPAGSDEIWQEYLARRITHFEALRHMFARIRATDAEMTRALADMRIDQGAARAVARLHAEGFGVFIASAGCGFYIERLLASLGLKPTVTPPWQEEPKTPGSVTLLANHGRFVVGEGLLLEPPRDSPFFHENTGTDKVAVVEAALAHAEVVFFAGDGPPDVAASLLVPPSRRFARGFLARHLESVGEEFRPFASWSEAAARIVEEAGSIC